jgi:SAM-dependent methyltransferase
MSDETAGLPRFLRDAVSWYSVQVLAMGHQLGLRAALMNGPGTVVDIAARSGMDERSTANWLRTMVAAGYAVHDHGVFSADPESGPFLAGEFDGFDVFAGLDQVIALGALTPAAIDAVRAGSAPTGLYSGVFGEATWRISGPVQEAALVADWLAGDEALIALLSNGARVVDLGCGNGTAVGIMARAFPNSTFVGVDQDPEAIPLAVASTTGLGNVAFGRELPTAADVVVVLDSFHHFAEPDVLLAQLRILLGAGGALVIVEPSFSGDLDADTASPFAAINLAAAFVYCDLEGRVAGKTGPIHPIDGGAGLLAALGDAGFATVTARDTENGYRVYVAR